MLNLTDAEIDLLANGLDAINTGMERDEAMASLIGGMLSHGDPRMKAVIEDERKQNRLKEQDSRRAKREDCVLLKAKLIAFRRDRNKADFGGEVENAAHAVS